MEAVNLLQVIKQASDLYLQGGNDSSQLSTRHSLFLSMHVYEQFQEKKAFSGLHTPFIHYRDKTLVLKSEISQTVSP